MHPVLGQTPSFALFKGETVNVVDSQEWRNRFGALAEFSQFGFARKGYSSNRGPIRSGGSWPVEKTAKKPLRIGCDDVTPCLNCLSTSPVPGGRRHEWENSTWNANPRT